MLTFSKSYCNSEHCFFENFPEPPIYNEKTKLRKEKKSNRIFYCFSKIVKKFNSCYQIKKSYKIQF